MLSHFILFPADGNKKGGGGGGRWRARGLPWACKITGTQSHTKQKIFTYMNEGTSTLPLLTKQNDYACGQFYNTH